MPEIQQITLGSNTYDIRDSRVDTLNNFEYAVCTSAADTPYGVTWESGGTTITGTLVAAATTMYKIYLVPSADAQGNDNYVEYITIRTGTDPSFTYSWEILGSITLPDLSGYMTKAEAGTLAYKDSATGSFTPQGSVSAPTITPSTTNVPNVTSVGSMPTFTVSNKNLTITAGVEPTLGTAIEVMTGATASQPSFTGTAGTVTVS